MAVRLQTRHWVLKSPSTGHSSGQGWLSHGAKVGSSQQGQKVEGAENLGWPRPQPCCHLQPEALQGKWGRWSIATRWPLGPAGLKSAPPPEAVGSDHFSPLPLILVGRGTPSFGTGSHIWHCFALCLAAPKARPAFTRLIRGILAKWQHLRGTGLDLSVINIHLGILGWQELFGA